MESEPKVNRLPDSKPSPSERLAHYMADRPQREALSSRLLETFTSAQAAERWVKAENSPLNAERPLDQIRAGRISSVESTLEAIDSGIFH